MEYNVTYSLLDFSCCEGRNKGYGAMIFRNARLDINLIQYNACQIDAIYWNISCFLLRYNPAFRDGRKSGQCVIK